MTAEEKMVQDCLKQSIEDFSTNPMSPQVMRRFATEAPGVFAPVAVGMLITGTNSPGYRYLAALVLWQPTLFRQIANPWLFTRQQAVDLSKRLLAVDPSFDIRFARQLPGRGGRTPETLTGPHAERALEILDEISPGSRVIPILSHLARDQDQKISARATLVIGRRVRNVAFTRRLIAEGTDARVRANALEAIWGEESREVRDLFWECLDDRHNRVVGNAMVGLYLLHEPKVIDLVRRYAGSAEPEFRRTSAWAIGRMGDRSFFPTLSPLVKDQNSGVRGAALQSLQKIREIEKDRARRKADIVALVQGFVPNDERQTPEPKEEVKPAQVEFAGFDLRLDGKQFAHAKERRIQQHAQW